LRHKKFQIYLKGEDRTDSVQEYKRIGNRYEVIFLGGKKFTYNAENVEVIESELNAPKSRDCFEYLTQLANEIGLKVDVGDGKSINILAQSYSKIEFVNPTSMLGRYLSSKIPENKMDDSDLIPVRVYPFGFNASQKKAVDKALLNQLSVIEGPPGTGKTQTILNIIANLIMRGESVAVVSSNNSAIKNVFDKLYKSELDFIAANLGNLTNKKEFIESQKPLPEMINWSIDSQTIQSIKKDLNERCIALDDKLGKQNKLSRFKQELSAFQTEERHFLGFTKSAGRNDQIEPVETIRTSSKALELWIVFENFESDSKLNGFWPALKRILSFLKFWDRNLSNARKLKDKYSGDVVIEALQHKFYQLKIQELSKEIKDLQQELESFDFDQKMRDYRDISLKLFRASLADKYQGRNREKYQIEDLRKRSHEFIEDYPLILSTTYSLRSSLSNEVKYDYVIIDESSQVDVCTGALALSCAHNAVIVGDLKQLSHVVDSQTRKLTDSIFSNFEISEAYRYSHHSLLSSVISLFPGIPKTLLREHYRCHPKIIEFCNQKFYNGELIILTENKIEREPLLVYKTIEGNHERKRINLRQIDVIRQEIIPDLSLNLEDGSLGIITPYRNQTNVLQKAFEGLKVKADTVDKFQGQEKSVVILSTVDNEISDFTDNANRLNVAISRAIDQLIVIVNEGDSLKDKNIGDLVNHIEYNNFSIVKSKVQSVFDYLFKSYRERRRAYLAKHKRVSDYDSENLFYGLLTKLLYEKQVHSLDVAVHVPLKLLLRDVSLLSESEKNYAFNVNTHVDFLIYDRVSKVPKLIIEVDGVSFHQEGSRQAERDAMKNEILKKYDLPILRLRTDGSGEDKILSDALNELINGV